MVIHSWLVSWIAYIYIFLVLGVSCHLKLPANFSSLTVQSIAMLTHLVAGLLKRKKPPLCSPLFRHSLATMLSSMPTSWTWSRLGRATRSWTMWAYLTVCSCSVRGEHWDVPFHLFPSLTLHCLILYSCLHSWGLNSPFSTKAMTCCVSTIHSWGRLHQRLTRWAKKLTSWSVRWIRGTTWSQHSIYQWVEPLMLCFSILSCLLKCYVSVQNGSPNEPLLLMDNPAV